MFVLQSAQPQHIEELWTGSYTALQELEAAASLAVADPLRDISNFVIITLLVTFLVFAHRSILQGTISVFSAVGNRKKLLAVETQSNLQMCRNRLFIFLTLCTCFVMANISHPLGVAWSEYPLPVKFIGLVLLFMLIFLCRRIALYFLAWVNNNSVFKLVYKITFTYVCLWNFLVLCSFFVIKSVPSALMGNMRYCIIFSTIAVMTLYFFALSRIILSKGFSHFFYILYLCTLEILPTIVLLSLNFR